MNATTEKMTRAQAQTLAAEQWDREPGPDEDKTRYEYGRVEKDDNGAEYRVGIQTIAGYHVKGFGQSWEAACRMAGLIPQEGADAR